jgi:hypothetical protein
MMIATITLGLANGFIELSGGCCGAQMEEKVKEIVEMKQRSLAEENHKSLEALRER